MVRLALYSATLFLYLLHNDLWLWDDPSMVLGLPVGLTYHVIFCLVAALLMVLLVRHAWPRHLEVNGDEDEPPS